MPRIRSILEIIKELCEKYGYAFAENTRDISISKTFGHELKEVTDTYKYDKIYKKWKLLTEVWRGDNLIFTRTRQFDFKELSEIITYIEKYVEDECLIGLNKEYPYTFIETGNMGKCLSVLLGKLYGNEIFVVIKQEEKDKYYYNFDMKCTDGLATHWGICYYKRPRNEVIEAIAGALDIMYGERDKQMIKARAIFEYAKPILRKQFDTEK